MDDVFSQLSPEELQQLIALGTLDEQQGLLGMDMEQAQAMQERGRGAAERRTSPWGTILGGIGGLISQGKGLHDAGQARRGMDDILGQKRQGRSVFADLIRRGGQGGSPAGMPPMIANVPPSPLGGDPSAIADASPMGMAQGHRLTMDALQPPGPPPSASALLRGRGKSPVGLPELELDPSLMGW